MSYLLLELIAQTAISHGDPGMRTDSNVMPFRMQEILYERPQRLLLEQDGPIGTEPEDLRTASIFEVEAALEQFVQDFPLPSTTVAGALQQLQAEKFVAVAFVTTVISQLNSLNAGNGSGLFTGKGRYDMLLKRMGIVASQYNTSFFSLYSSLLNELLVTETLPKMEDFLYTFAALPRSIQQSAIAVLGKERQAVIMLARAWFNAMREPKSVQPSYYDPKRKFAGIGQEDVEALVPHISTNAIRHSVFREVLCVHLLQACGFGSIVETSQRQLLPDYVIQLLSNGGNVKDGANQPDNREAINAAVKQTFPSLELLSGCLPTHIMGEGMLRPANWTLCLQNNTATLEYGYRRDIDASALLSIETHTRQTPDGMASTREAGQMLYAHTVMKPGARILLKVGFLPFTSPLAKGAAYFAVKEWLAQGGQVGGRDSVGEGHFQATPSGISVRSTSIGDPDDLSQYEAYAKQYQHYIEANGEMLREALTSGTLGWREPIKAR